jgi:hypothetical protein
MASFALLQAFSGFHYSKRNKVLKFAPRVKHRPFQSFFATADAHGTITLKENMLQIEVIEGELDVKQIELKPKLGSKGVICQVDVIVRAGKKFVLQFPISKSARGGKS